MKIKITIVAVLSLLSVLYLFSTGDKEQVVKQGPNTSHLHVAIGTHVLDLFKGGDTHITMIIPGQQIRDGQWRFTGSLKDGRANKPFYGVIASICADYTDLACWGLAEFTVDGEPIKLAKVQEIDELQVDHALKSGENLSASEISGAVESSDKEAVAISENVTDLKLDKPTQKVSAATFWKSKSNNVNSRSGPGSDFPKVFKMPSYVKLTLVREKQGWGLFSFVAQGGGKSEVWIAKSLVVPYE